MLRAFSKLNPEATYNIHLALAWSGIPTMDSQTQEVFEYLELFTWGQSTMTAIIRLPSDSLLP